MRACKPWGKHYPSCQYIYLNLLWNARKERVWIKIEIPDANGRHCKLHFFRPCFSMTFATNAPAYLLAF